MREENLNIEVNHQNCSNETLLEELITGADTVVFFNHDYFSLVPDKNQQLLTSTKLAKELNVKKFIVVSPIEYINYYTASNGVLDNPYEEEEQTHKKVL